MLSMKFCPSRTLSRTIFSSYSVRPSNVSVTTDNPLTQFILTDQLLADELAKNHSKINFMSVEERAVLPFDSEYSENNLVIISAMEEVLSSSDPDMGESKKQAFLHLIKSIQNPKLFASVREKLVLLIEALNEKKAFVKINLSGLDFSGVVMAVKKLDLSGATIRNANFVGADFSYTNLANADMTDSDFTNANFRYANLNRTDLSGVCFLHCQFIGAEMFRTVLPPLWTSIKLSSSGTCLEMQALIVRYRKNSE